MEAHSSSDIFLFGHFQLDRRGLFRRDEPDMLVPIAIGSRAMEVLRVLVAACGDVVAKDQIKAVVWPGTVVGDNNLTVHISALRRIFNQERADGSYIQTAPGRGYRFLPAVARGTADEALGALAISEGSAHPPPRLSIVVLPFANLSNDPDQDYFADGITDDLTTDLSRISGSFVIARSSAYTYKGKAIEARQVGRELGVRYILEGSVRRSGNRVRVNTQLIDADTDGHLWAERFDSYIGDLFTLQDEITSRIAVELNLELIGAEASRPAEHPDALHHILRGRAALSMPATPESYAKAISLFAHALALDPHSVEAQSWLATALGSRAAELMTDSAELDIARAETLVGQVLMASPRHPVAHFAKGQLLRAQSRPQEAMPEFEAAIASNRNWAYALYALGQCKFLTGLIEEAIPLVEHAIRLSPRDPYVARWYCWIGRVHLLQSRTDEAIPWLEKARAFNAGLPMVRDSLAATYALKNDTERAATELAEARRLSGDDRYSSIARWKATRFWGVPSIRALYDTIYFPALRKAGMPEE
jgi:TolB-like protein